MPPDLRQNLLAMQGRAIAKLFSASVFRTLWKSDAVNSLRDYLGKAALPTRLKGQQVGQIFDYAYDVLSAQYRNEYFYKNELTKKILLGRHSLSTSRLLTEFWIQDVKADLAIVNGTSSVYEIKTDYDDLDRLQKQLDSCSHVFDRIYVVTSETMSRTLLDKLPSFAGLIVLTSRKRLSVRKEAESNIPNVKTDAIFKSLRMGEVRAICESLGAQLSGPNSTWAAQAWERFKQLTPCEAHEAMVKALKQRPIHSRQLAFIEAVPHSLKHLSIVKTLPIGNYEPTLDRLRAAF